VHSQRFSTHFSLKLCIPNSKLWRTRLFVLNFSYSLAQTVPLRLGGGEEADAQADAKQNPSEGTHLQQHQLALQAIYCAFVVQNLLPGGTSTTETGNRPAF
jgi:hypothetical protein